MITPSKTNAFIFLYSFSCSGFISLYNSLSFSVDGSDPDVKYAVSPTIAVLGCSIYIFTFLPGLRYTDSK